MSCTIDIDVVWVSDIRFEEISDFFEHTPYMRDYTRYNEYWTDINRVTVPFSMKDGKLKIIVWIGHMNYFLKGRTGMILQASMRRYTDKEKKIEKP